MLLSVAVSEGSIAGWACSEYAPTKPSPFVPDQILYGVAQGPCGDGAVVIQKSATGLMNCWPIQTYAPKAEE